MLSNTGPEPTWWTDFINTNVVSDAGVESPVHQEGPFASASVSETSSATPVGSPSIEAAFQTTSQPFGSYRQSFGVNASANFDIDLRPQANLAFPNGTNSKSVQDSTSPVQFDWNFMTSSSALRYYCDIHDKNSRSFTTPPSESFCQESQERRKRPISRLHPFECPYCRNHISSKRVRYAILPYRF